MTIETNWVSWRKAKRNLARFPFVQPVWGKTVTTIDALEFVRKDEFLRDHEKWTDIFIDDTTDPVAFYTNEISGLLRRSSSYRSYPLRLLEALDRRFRFHGEDLLRRYLRSFGGSRLLVALDSSGGIGFLEFKIVLETLATSPYLLLLDDIHHLKHYRSHMHIASDPGFKIIAINREHGWLLADHR